MANREKSKIAATRLTVEEYKTLEEIASDKGVSVSMIVYECISKLIGGEVKSSLGMITEQILESHLDQLKRDLLQELKQQQSEKKQPSKPISHSDPGLSARSLSKRLGIDRKTLTRWKEKGNEFLIERTRERDPDGKAWVFDEGSKMYLEESNEV